MEVWGLFTEDASPTCRGWVSVQLGFPGIRDPTRGVIVVRITVLGVHFKGPGSLETLTLNKTRAPTRWTPESFRSSGNSTSKSKSQIYLHSSSVCLES